MASTSAWVQQIVAKCQEGPMGTEKVLFSLEKHVGQGEKSLGKIQEVLEYIDRELVERRGGLIMRQLWQTVADYQDKVLEGRAAA